MKQQSHFGKQQIKRGGQGGRQGPVCPGQGPGRGSKGAKPTGRKRICAFSHASEKLSMNQDCSFLSFKKVVKYLK